MQRSTLQRALTSCIVGASFVAATASAQVGVETFSGGNSDGWQIWFAPYNYLRATGGNPGAYFELDDVTSGPATCQFLNIFPDRATAGTLSHAGNWRAAGVDQVSIDVNIRTGPLNGVLTLLLVSDPGTPTVPADDCTIRLSQVTTGPIAIGWTTLTFPVDASQVVAPIGWIIDPASTGCTGASLNQIWNSVIQDVDEVRFRYDTTPGFCAFTRWQFGIDNITIGMPGPGGPGVNYCTAVINSTGSAAAMAATGSNMVAANSLTLTCSSMPNNAFGYFLTSATQGLVMNPGGSQGDLCLGGSIGRYVGPGQIQNSGATGGIGLALDLTQHPTPAGFVQVMPGETWHFTCWFRDAVGGSATSNFADGYTVVFQ